jgi:AcrR family transcriptional regulator
MIPHPRDGQESRRVLVVTAMRLFADQGIEAVSVRSVNRAAGLAAAAVHYHFGSKDALLDAAVAYHAHHVLSAIEAACDGLLNQPRRPEPALLVGAFASPYRALLQRDPTTGRPWLAMVAQLIASGDARMAELAAPVTRKLEAVTTRAFPGASADRIRLALPIALMTFILMVVQDAKAPLDEGRTDTITEFVTGGLVAVLAAGAPPLPSTSAA